MLPEARGRGAGIALFRACAREAVAQSCGRMEWQVLSWNTPSIEFYQRLGARHMDDWLPFRLDDDALGSSRRLELELSLTAGWWIPHTAVGGTLPAGPFRGTVN